MLLRWEMGHGWQVRSWRGNRWFLLRWRGWGARPELKGLHRQGRWVLGGTLILEEGRDGAPGFGAVKPSSPWSVATISRKGSEKRHMYRPEHVTGDSSLSSCRRREMWQGIWLLEMSWGLCEPCHCLQDGFSTILADLCDLQRSSLFVKWKFHLNMAALLRVAKRFSEHEALGKDLLSPLKRGWRGYVHMGKYLKTTGLEYKVFYLGTAWQWMSQLFKDLPDCNALHPKCFLHLYLLFLGSLKHKAFAHTPDSPVDQNKA